MKYNEMRRTKGLQFHWRSDDEKECW